jgi:hypothetical protein
MWILPLVPSLLLCFPRGKILPVTLQVRSLHPDNSDLITNEAMVPSLNQIRQSDSLEIKLLCKPSAKTHFMIDEETDLRIDN